MTDSHKRGSRMILVAATLLVVAGCTVGPDYKKPATRVPEAFAGGTSSTGERLPNAWWTLLGDPVLNDLVRQALQSSPDLAVAETRVRQARAVRGIVGAAELPDVNAGGFYARS